MRLRNNIENMYKKSGNAGDPDRLIYSGGETSGLESSFTSPSVQHKDFIEQYLNKLSYLPGDVITNHSEHHPMLTLGTTQIPQINSTSYTSPFLSAAATTTPAALPLTTSGLNGGMAGMGDRGLHDLLDTKDLLYNSLSSDVLFDATAGGVTTGGGSNMVDMLDVPGNFLHNGCPNKFSLIYFNVGKGRCFVYFARYSYEPFSQSLNDNPESELPLNAGDYVLVWGDADEDGYLEGELLDGRKGLVPMNFCERLQGEDLLEFHQQVVLGFSSEEEVWSTMVPTDLPIDLQGSTQNLTQVGQAGGVGGVGQGMTGIDSSGLMATPIDEPISYTNPCK